LSFAHPVSLVDLTLAQMAQPATATAYDAGGAALATATMTGPQGIPENLKLVGTGITSVVVDSPSNEVVMPQVCWEL